MLFLVSLAVMENNVTNTYGVQVHWYADLKNSSSTSNSELTNLCLASHKRDIGKPCRPRSDAVASDQGLHCFIKYRNFYKTW